MVKFKKGELISYKSTSSKKRLGIVISDPYLSKAGWKVKTYCDGTIYNNSVDSVGRVCDEVELVKPYHTGY
tara:strand:- start:10646 stop:10858 length:213 start_codon:yes stop_codon:yes gene_type:complete